MIGWWALRDSNLDDGLRSLVAESGCRSVNSESGTSVIRLLIAGESSGETPHSAFAGGRLMTAHQPAGSNRATALRNVLLSARVAALVSLGVRLGLYQAMKDGSRLTSADLASRTAYHERWVLEWLRGQAAAGIVAYDGEGRFELPPEIAVLLANANDLGYVGHQFEFLPDWMGIVERLPEAFRTGLGLSWDDRGSWSAERIEKVFRNWYRQVLVPTALPQLDGVVPRLESGGTVADVGCGAGLALIEMAKAFPRSEFHGYEVSEHALARAEKHREEAQEANVYFHNVASEPLPADGSFDLVCTLDCLHDMTHPHREAASIRRAIKEDGVWFIADVNCAPTFEENLKNPMAPGLYAASVLQCLPAGLSEPGGAGLGTLGLPEPKMKELVERAGFTRFRRLDLPSPLNAYYEARA